MSVPPFRKRYPTVCKTGPECEADKFVCLFIAGSPSQALRASSPKGGAIGKPVLHVLNEKSPRTGQAVGFAFYSTFLRAIQTI